MSLLFINNDLADGTLAVLVNQAVFGYLAPNAIQTQAQVAYIHAYNQLVPGIGFAEPGVEQLIKVYVNQGIGLFGPATTLATIAETSYNNVYGPGTATPAIINFLVNAYSKYGADAKWIIPLNIVLQFANAGSAQNILTQYLEKEGDGVASFNTSLYNLTNSAIIITGPSAVWNGTNLDDTFITAKSSHIDGATFIDGLTGNNKLLINDSGLPFLDITGPFFGTNLQTIQTAGNSVDLQNVSNALQHLIVQNSSSVPTVFFENIAAGSVVNGGDVSVINSTSSVCINFQPAALTGAADKLDVKLNGMGLSTTGTALQVSQGGPFPGGSGASLETLALHTSGTGSVLTGGIQVDTTGPTVGTLAKLTIDGSASIQIGNRNGLGNGVGGNALVDQNPTLTLIDLTGLTVASTIFAEVDHVAAGGTSKSFSYTGGSANDYLYIGSALLTGAPGFTGTLNGAGGVNTLAFGQLADVKATAGFGGSDLFGQITNFTKAVFEETQGTFAPDMGNLEKAGIFDFTFNGGANAGFATLAAATTLDFKDLSANATSTFHFTNSTAAGTSGTLSFDPGAAGGAANGGTDNIALDFQSKGHGAAVGADGVWTLTASPQIDNLSINVAAGSNDTVAMTGSWADLKSINLTEAGTTLANGTLVLTGPGGALTPLLSLIEGGTITQEAIEVFGFNGNLTIRTGSLNDDLFAGTGTQSLVGGLGADLFGGAGAGNIDTFSVQFATAPGNFLTTSDAALLTAADAFGIVHAKGMDAINLASFQVGEDKLAFVGGSDGSAANTFTAAAQTSWVNALIAADNAMSTPGIKYVVVTETDAADFGGFFGAPTTIVFADINGDGKADTGVAIAGAVAVTFADIIAG